MERKPSAWTNQWMRELPYRELKRMLAFPFDDSWDALQKQRWLRLQDEWKRRKKEGRGGWAAEKVS
jgi:hypothetical protein